MIRASFLIRLFGDFGQAAWLDRQLSRVGGVVWFARQRIIRATEQDPKLQELIQQYRYRKSEPEPEPEPEPSVPDGDALDVFREARGMGKGNER